MEEKETIETITKAYEERIAEREKQVLQEKEDLKKQLEKEKEDALKVEREKHNKEIADIILGRKSAEEVQNKEQNDEKSFFDKAVENTKKKLKGGK